QLLKLLRFSQKLDNLFQFFFRFVDAGHVLERHFLLLHRQQAGAALAERQRLVSAGLHLADHEEPERGQKDDRGQVEQPSRPSTTTDVTELDGYALAAQSVDHGRIVDRTSRVELGLVVAILASDFLTVDSDFLDIALVHVSHELGKVDFPVLLAARASAHNLPKQEGGNHNNQPEN